jgi:hypothetical protein
MKQLKLNEKELQVLEACKKAAKREGDNGYEFCISSLKISDMDQNSIKGYLGQLTLKGLVEKFEDSYFDFGVIGLTPEYLRIDG